MGTIGVMSAIVTPVISLVAVRSELIADADSSSNFTVSPTECVVKGDSSLNIKSADDNTALTPDTDCSEPFPEYEETPKEDDSFDIAYKAAMGATIQDTIRARDVEPGILKTTHQSDKSDKKEQTLNALKEGLSHPHLQESSRERFIALTNMVIRLDNILFSANAGDPDTQATNDALRISDEIFSFVTWVDEMMRDLAAAAGNVYNMLKHLANDDKVTELDRHLNMSQLISAHLKKPRRVEEKVLSLFLELYDEWIHNKFLQSRNGQVTPVAEILDIDRLELTRSIHAIWDTLTRAIENYSTYRDMLDKIKEKYFAELIERIPTTYGAVARCFQEDYPL